MKINWLAIYYKTIKARSWKYQALVTLLLSVTLFLSLQFLVKIPFLNQILQNFTVKPPEFINSGGLNPFLALTSVVAILLYSFMDYHQHLNPLKKEMPTVIYTPGHYARVVLIP